MAVEYIGILSQILVERYGIRKTDAMALSWGGLQETKTFSDKSMIDKNKVLNGIPWVIEFEVTNYKINHIDEVLDISVSSGSFFSELNF
ncbi:hypothetical protein SAMN03080598_02621 [Algoriphagus boritolerans DSM 17298 = JCM 18970]|uniref:Uncharacterized protein n=1 Tax=Algoriphagus boritolerans DSM 17298 = JCM 18970 TaxID=1120964 RepID=A0A1H5XRE3_9BACT|nr:hypothetical protein SAMN03080598_02621 [Algoriphagus boritolerans DSM 17298 = JCM 18970]